MKLTDRALSVLARGLVRRLVYLLTCPSCHDEPPEDGSCHFVWARFGHGLKREQGGHERVHLVPARPVPVGRGLAKLPAACGLDCEFSSCLPSALAPATISTLPRLHPQCRSGPPTNPIELRFTTRPPWVSLRGTAPADHWP